MFDTETKKQILIVDGDVSASEPLRHKLSEAGFFVRTIADGSAAVAAIAKRPPHLVIIDWNMPGFMALELIQVIKSARAHQPVRLIILSALAAEQDVVSGLNFGADDYVAKPFSLREVVARVSALLRSRHGSEQSSILCYDTLVLNTATNRATVGGQDLNLRGIEYRLLVFLMTNAGKTFNRTRLLQHVWGNDTTVDERTVDVNVQRLRRLLSASGYEACIQTVRGFGYRFCAPARTNGPSHEPSWDADRTVDPARP